MKRRESREQAFALMFEKSFRDLPVEELALQAAEARDAGTSGFSMTLARGAEEHMEELDARIAACSQKWSKERISRVALAVMRVALYEMLYEKDTPESVAINEAVELAKKYGGEEDASFVNGILGTVSRAGANGGEAE